MKTLARFNGRNNGFVNPFYYDPILSSFFNADLHNPSEAMVPRTNIRELESQFALDIAIPGYSKDDVSINVEQNVLVVSGKKEQTDEQSTYSKREFVYGEFKRSFTLSENIDQEHISAKFVDGILTISLPKREKVLPKVINIQVEG